jgi:mono/diheme cytochrome c family protein
MRNFLFLTFIVYSCTWRKEITPASDIVNCDTIDVTYSKIIQPILKTNCYSCHSTTVTANGGSLDIQNFSSLTNYLNNNYDGVFGSQFYRVISQTPGTLPMPPVGKLSDCDIAKIKSWINKKAPNN